MLLPKETSLPLINSLFSRQAQVRQLTALLSGPCPSTLVVHGVEATGKSLTIRAILDASDTPSAIIQSQECITTRHLLERTIFSVKDSLKKHTKVNIEDDGDGRCESISAFVALLQQVLEGRGKFILVLDGIDRQREPAPTLLPAMARLGEMVSILPKGLEGSHTDVPRSQI